MKARIRGTEIYFDVEGPGLVPTGDQLSARPPLFLLHGGPGGDHSGFRTPAIQNLRNVAQIVYIDHRGSGRSAPADPATYTLEENITDVDALREYLGFEQICVLGQSYGGMVAQGYAIAFPEQVSKLILVATAPSYRFMNDAKRIVLERGTPGQIRVCERLWNASFESMEQLHEYYQLMSPLYSVAAEPARFEESWHRGIRSFEQLNLGFGSFMLSFDFTDKLHTIPCPTLVLAGAHDWICPPNHSEEITRRIPQAQLQIFPNSSHSITADEPDAFETTVREFLTCDSCPSGQVREPFKSDMATERKA